MHCVIVGAGIFGVTGAIEMQTRGHRVTLVDPGPIPHRDASSTDISKIVRMDYGADAFYCELMERAMDGWRSYNNAWPEPLYHEQGFCILSSTPLERGTFAGDSYAMLTERGHPLHRLDGDAITSRYPLWRDGAYVDGYFNPRAGWAESGRVVAALCARARELGVTIREGERAIGLVEGDSGVTGVRVQAEGGGDHTRIDADVVVVAMGAWTTALLPKLAHLLTPVVQPVLHFRPERADRFATPALVPWAADIQTTGFYGFPATTDGVVKVANHGAGIAIDPDDDRLPPMDVDTRFREFLRSSLPDLAEAPIVYRRQCRYCDSKDGDFLIARDPERHGLVVAAGGSGHGFKFAPVLGELIADAVDGANNPSLSRFGWRVIQGHSYETARCRE